MKTPEDTFVTFARLVARVPKEEHPYMWWVLHKHVEYFAAELEGRLTSEGRQFLDAFRMMRPDSTKEERQASDDVCRGLYQQATANEGVQA